jgi:hypothetical protein
VILEAILLELGTPTTGKLPRIPLLRLSGNS